MPATSPTPPRPRPPTLAVLPGALLLLATAAGCGSSSTGGPPDPCDLVNAEALVAAGVAESEPEEGLDEDGESAEIAIHDDAEEYAVCSWQLAPDGEAPLEAGPAVRDLTVVVERMPDADTAAAVFESWLGPEDVEELDLAEEAVLWRYVQGPAVALLRDGATVARVQLLAMDFDGDTMNPVDDEEILDAVRPAAESVADGL